MTTATTPATLTVQPGSNGRYHVLDGHKVVKTFRNLMLAVDFAAGINEPDYEGPSCSICDGLGHGYPGGRPCPLEDRGWADAMDDEWMGW